jgi:hypothetical protein
MKSLSARFMSFLLPVRAKRDGFLSDSFLSEFFWNGAEDSSRTGLPKAACGPMICGHQRPFVARNDRGAAQHAP